MSLPEDIIRDEVRGMSAYHVPAAQGMIKLDAMENPYPLPESLRAELGVLLKDVPLNRYPDASGVSLKQRLREVLDIPGGLDILLGNGSDEIIQMMILACARPGATVMAPGPTFAMYRQYALIAGLQYVGVSLRADFSLDVEKFAEAMAEHKPAIVFISYPNNPTGNLFDTDDLHRIIVKAPGLVVIDEAYHPFAGQTFMGDLEGLHNVVLLRTLSKLGLAGIRLGYAVGRSAWLGEFDKVRSPYNVSVLTQAVAEKVLDHHEVLDQQAAAIRAERTRLAEALDSVPGIQPFPSKANFILCRVPAAGRAFEKLREKGVLVKSMHGMHPLLRECLRITVGTPVENTKLLASLREVLGSGTNGA